MVYRSPSRRRFLKKTSWFGLGMGIGLPFGQRLWAPPAASEKKLGVALVGLGSYSTGQLGPALRETQYCRLTGVVTGDRAKGQRWARNYGFPESSVYHYDTMNQMAENSDIDIVYVVTPPGLHMEHTIKGFAAGKHVICEKPMAISVRECDLMLEAAEETGRMLSLGYRLHFHPYHEQVKALAREKAWGGFREMSGGFGYRMSSPSWRQTQALGGGGQLMNVGIYVIQSACMAKDEALPIAVRAEEPPKKRPDFFQEVEETLYFTLEFEDGSTCRGETSGQEYSNFFRAEAPEGWLEMQPAFSYGGLRMETHQGSIEPLRNFNQQAAQMDAFAQAIREGRPSTVPGEMGRRDMRIIETIYRAAETGQREKV